MSKNYTTSTASLKATTIDSRLLSASGKIEVGNVVKDEQGNITQGTQITPDGITTKSIAVEKDGVRTDLVDFVTDIAESIPTGIGVGTQKDPFDDSTPETGFATGISKINFKGKYVNVIKTSKADEVTLWIQPNESVADFDKVPTPATTSYKLYNTADYTLPVTAGNSTGVTQIQKEGTAFSDITLTAVNKDGASPSTINSREDSIWWRVNGGEFAQQPITASIVKDGKGAGEDEYVPNISSKTKDSVTCTISANKIWHNADAEDGKVPGQAEVAFSLKVATATLAPNGGSIKVEYVVQKDEPTADTQWTAINMFVSKYKDPAISTATATLTTPQTISVSGIKYLTTDSEYTVEATGIANTQHKIGNTSNRVRISGASGTAKNYAATTKRNDQTSVNALTRTDSNSSDANSSDAAFSFVDTYKVGATGTPGTAVSLTMHASKHSDTGNPSGVAKSISLGSKFWGASRTQSSDVYELFMQENKRTDASGAAFSDADFDVTTDAVVQNGKLFHVATTSTDLKTGYAGGTSDSGKWTSTATQCSFCRIFKGTSSDTCASLTISDCNSSGTATTGTSLSTLARNGKIEIRLRGISSTGALEAATWNCGKYSSETGTDPVVGMLKEVSNGKLVCTVAGLAFPKNKGCLIEVIIKDKTAVVSPFRVDLT